MIDMLADAIENGGLIIRIPAALLLVECIAIIGWCLSQWL